MSPAGNHRVRTRREHDGRRDDGEADLVRAVERREQWRFAFLDAPMRVLEHDDRVVDDEADRQHEREQRHEVDRVAEQREHGERRDQAQRNRDGGISVARS